MLLQPASCLPRRLPRPFAVADQLQPHCAEAHKLCYGQILGKQTDNKSGGSSTSARHAEGRHLQQQLALRPSILVGILSAQSTDSGYMSPHKSSRVSYGYAAAKVFNKSKCMNVLQAQQKHSLPMASYSLWAYLAYVYYPPLYIAGPICTFNAFARQCTQTSATQYRQVRRKCIDAMRKFVIGVVSCSTSCKKRSCKVLGAKVVN